MAVNMVDGPDANLLVWRLSWGPILVAAVVAGLSLWLFWDGIWLLGINWTTTPEYSHCLLIPPIAAFLIWQQKDRLERVPFEGSWWGLALVLLGGAMLVLGQLGTIYTLVQYAYVVTLYGLIMAFTGTRVFRIILIPMAILLFMIPLPSFFYYNLSTKLQLISSEWGVWFMRLIGITVFAEGNVIDLGGYKLQVAEACNGLRYLFPLMTLGFLMANFYKGALWKRVVLFLSSIPITLLMNSWRVGTIGFMVEHWGIGMAEGFLHEFQGWAVFMLCALLMIAEVAALTRIGHESGTWRELLGIDFPAPTPRNATVAKRPIPNAFLAASVLLSVFVVIALLMPRAAEIIPERAQFVDFPMHVGAWRGTRQSMEGVYLDQLKLDDYVLADYVNDAGRQLNFYGSYYNSQRKGDAVHSPRACLPGGGWQFKEFDQRTLPLSINGQPLRVNRAVIELGNQHQLMYYWFQQRGRIITNEFAVKWYIFLDAITRHRTDGAMVRVIVPVPVGQDAAVADRDMLEFTARIAPDISRFVPN